MHQQSCKNGCEFAKQIHLMSYATKNVDGTYSDADYLYKCTKIDRIISLDSTVYELGCVTYNYVRVEPPCICTPNPEPVVTLSSEINVIPVTGVYPIYDNKTGLTMIGFDTVVHNTVEPVVVVATPEVPIPVTRVEPKFVPEPSVSVPPAPVAVPKVRKPRTKPAVTVTVPVAPIITETIPVVSVPADTTTVQKG